MYGLVQHLGYRLWTLVRLVLPMVFMDVTETINIFLFGVLSRDFLIKYGESITSNYIVLAYYTFIPIWNDRSEGGVNDKKHFPRYETRWRETHTVLAIVECSRETHLITRFLKFCLGICDLWCNTFHSTLLSMFFLWYVRRI